MNINPTIFRKYDIRGVVDRDLTDDTVRAIGVAFGRFLKQRTGKTNGTVVMAGDARESTPRFIGILTEGLNHCGIRVIDGGLVPTPVLYFAVQDMGVDGGVMVTASHNPPEFNGFKMLLGTDALSGDDIQELYQLARGPEPDPVAIDRDNVKADLLTPYRKWFREHFPADTAAGLQVVVDAGNGIAGPVGPDIYEAMGATVTRMYCEVDGSFPNHHPDPTVEANVQDMIRVVKDKGADLGIAFDGDGDRLGVVDDKGRIIWGDQLMTLFALDILKDRPGATFIGEVKCSRVLYDEIRKAGGNPIMWKTGHSIIKRKMKEVGAAMAGEMSGHLFFADRYFGFDDAIYAGARMMQLIRRAKEPLSAIFDRLPKMVSTPEIKVDCPDERKFDVIDAMIRAAESGNGPTDLRELVTIDGLRMTFDEGWSLIRASNTQPVLVLRFEAASEAALADIRTRTELFLQHHLNT